MSLIGLVIVLIVIGLLLWAVEQLPLDGTIRVIIRVVVILAVCLWLLSAVGAFDAGPALPRFHR